MFNRNRICILLLIFIVIGVFIMPGFFGNMTKNIIDHIKYRGTLVTGEITVDNENGTYDVKINNASSAYKSVETVTYGAVFSVGEIVVIGYEYGNKELPKILGHSKKIPQEPYESEVDYSGGGEDGEGSGEGEGGGKQTVTVTITGDLADGVLHTTGANYTTCHNAAVADVDPELDPDTLAIGQGYSVPLNEYVINRTALIFDLSSLPSNANKISAIVKVYCDTGGKTLVGTDFDIVVQDGQPTYPHKPVVMADYDKDFYHNNGGSINTANVSEDAWNNITLNSNGIAWLPMGGWAKLILRSSREIAGIVPTGNEGVNFLATNYGPNSKPKITITYEI